MTVTTGTILVKCTFERGTECDFKDVDDGSDNLNWRTNEVNTPSSRTGPSGAYEGYRYSYMEASRRQPQDKAILKLDKTPPASASCLIFAYHMFGSNMGSLYVKAGTNTLFTKSGNQGLSWHEQRVPITGSAESITITAERGSDYTSDIAIDDIQLIKGGCECALSPCLHGGSCVPVPASGSYTCTCPAPYTGTNCENMAVQEFTCNFEVDNDPNCYFHNALSDHFDWQRNTGSTPTNYTGPSEAFAGQGYVYTEADPQRRFDHAVLSSPIFTDPTESPKCLIFYYHMEVKSQNTLLEVETVGTLGVPQNVFTRSGRQGPSWQQGSVDIANVNNKKIQFIGTVGHGTQADIALDKIKLLNGKCMNHLQFCGFENKEETCFLHNSRYFDNLDFTYSYTVPNPSPTSGTGPTSAQEGQDYAYIETNGKGQMAGKYAVLTTYGMAFNNVAMCLELYYHMKGAHIGHLDIYSGEFYTNSYQIRHTLSGESTQPDNWHHLQVDIPANPNQVIDLEAVTVGGTKGDISIDNVRLHEGACV